MSKKKYIIGNFFDEEILFSSIEKVKASGYKIYDVFTPFPVQGLDKALGLRETKLHTAGFVYGVIGACVALGFIIWASTIDWAINFGGKPFFALPAWVPVVFEITILFAAAGMVFSFAWRSHLAPGVKKAHFNFRATDDTFTMALECDLNTNEAEAIALLNSVGAKDVSVQEKETRWWFGRYDREKH